MLANAVLGQLSVATPLLGFVLALLGQRREPVVVQLPEQQLNLTCVCSLPIANCHDERYLIAALLVLSATLVLLVLISVSAVCRRSAPARQVTHADLVRQRSAHRSLI